MQMSYSRVSGFEQCPFKWFLHYIEGFETIDKCDPADALKLGTALHEGIETEVPESIHKYFMSYPIIDDKHENEAIKLRKLIPKVKNILPPGGQFEVELNCDDFKGFIDYLVPVGYDRQDHTSPQKDGVSEWKIYDIYDFKYSNNVDRYLESGQLHVYKYFAEKLLGIKIRNLYFVFVPKTMIRQKKTEDLFQFRQRLEETLERMEPTIEQVEYDPNKVIEFLISTKHVIESQEYEKRESRLCDWCEYQSYCQKGDLIDMALPKNERVQVNATKQIKGWIYGAPFSGKTTFLDQAPDPLNLNTDGNTNYVTMQRVRIRDTYEGRIKKFGWEIFKEMIDELEKGSDFKTVIVDLVEDTREMCRVYMYDKLNIQHESDSGYGKGWDIIKTEYLSTMRRFMNLDYNIFLVSHEDVSKELTRNSGERITKIAPNIQEAIANKLAGMVDFVGRVVVKDDDSRVLTFKTNEVIFGGGRLNFGVNEIPLEWDELMKLYEGLSINDVEKNRLETKTEVPVSDNSDEKTTEEPVNEAEPVEAPKKRRSRKTEEVTPNSVDSDETVSTPEPVEEETPKRTRRRRTVEE